MAAPDLLVTGATGKTGRELCRALDERGVDHLRATRRPDGPRARRLDLRDEATWDGALAGVRRLFLMRPPDIADIDATLGPFVARARGAGVSHIVFLSVAGAERLGFLPHAGVERHLTRGPRDWTILRPDFFAQNLEDAYLRDIVEDDRLYVPAGAARVAFVDLRDVGAVAAECLLAPEAHRGAAYHLTGPAAFGFDEVAAALSRVTGRAVAYRPASVPGYVRHLRRRGAPWGLVAVQTGLHVALRGGRSATVHGDLAAVLGRPGGTVVDYVERAAAIWRR